MKTTTDSYTAHLDELRRRYDSVLAATDFDHIVLTAGQPHPIWLDDQTLPFKPNPYLLQWGPLLEHPGSVLIVSAGQRPRWLVYTPTDYWHQVPAVPDLLATSAAAVELVDSVEKMSAAVAALTGRRALLGEAQAGAADRDSSATNPPEIVSALNEHRTCKTAWEVDNIRAASRAAVRGHRAAEACFLAGGSEYDIHLAFRAACRQTDTELPYPAIVALNRNAATLHYQRLERTVSQSLSLLIDAGSSHHGYASDITRTHSEDAEFGALIEALHEVQRALCEAAQPGTDYRELHHAAHHALAGLLHDAEILSCSAATAQAEGLVQRFFPHGLGHFLGLQVHDVGALYTRRTADAPPASDADQHLRLTRVLEPGNVLTIEPGIYFIESLLDELRASPGARHVNWSRVKELTPFGGIRIEDNLHITATGNENLTREAFAQGE